MTVSVEMTLEKGRILIDLSLDLVFLLAFGPARLQGLTAVAHLLGWVEALVYSGGSGFLKTMMK